PWLSGTLAAPAWHNNDLPWLWVPAFAGTTPEFPDAALRLSATRSRYDVLLRPFEQPHQRRLRQRVEVQVEADDRSRSVGFHLQLFLRDREDGEDIAMRMIVGRRAGADITGFADIVAGHERALRQLRRAGVAGIERQLGGGGRNVDDQPVPEAAAGRRIRIEAGQGKALGSIRRARPGQLRR